jgi:ubiquitin
MKKADIIYACSTVLEEYINESHHTTRDDCALCVLANEKYDKALSRSNEKAESECLTCIMLPFSPQNYLNDIPCFQRKCRPVHCDEFKSLKMLSAVTEFYKRMLGWFGELSEEEINDFSILEHLKDIDYHVALEHGLISQ